MDRSRSRSGSKWLNHWINSTDRNGIRNMAGTWRNSPWWEAWKAGSGQARDPLAQFLGPVGALSGVRETGQAGARGQQSLMAGE